jgi:hypothetical protein
MSISEGTKRRLIADSGGICAKPDCTNELFALLPDGSVDTIAQRAHIIAQSEDGPRGHEDLDEAERDEYENLVLLCANCHITVDGHSDLYPVTALQQWKAEHRKKVRFGLQYPRLTEREPLNAEIRGLLRSNRTIHRTFGPESPNAATSVDNAARWRQESVRVIVPNNARILGLLRANDHLLSEPERDVVEDFAVHADGFAYNKLSGNKSAAVPLFPPDFPSLFQCKTNA